MSKDDAHRLSRRTPRDEEMIDVVVFFFVLLKRDSPSSPVYWSFDEPRLDDDATRRVGRRTKSVGEHSRDETRRMELMDAFSGVYERTRTGVDEIRRRFEAVDGCCRVERNYVLIAEDEMTTRQKKSTEEDVGEVDDIDDEKEWEEAH